MSSQILTPELLIFRTDTDQRDYPIYVSHDNQIFIKKKPQNIKAIFYVKNIRDTITTSEAIERIRETLGEEVLSRVTDLVDKFREVTKSDPIVNFVEINYEVYSVENGVEKFIGEVTAYAIRLIVSYFDRVEYRKKCFAIVYNWRDRLLAKYGSQLNKDYMYVKASETRKSITVSLYYKIPIPTREFTEIFTKVIYGVEELAKTVKSSEDREKIIKVISDLLNQRVQNINNILNSNKPIHEILREIVYEVLQFLNEIKEIKEVVNEQDQIIDTFRLNQFLERVRRGE